MWVENIFVQSCKYSNTKTKSLLFRVNRCFICKIFTILKDKSMIQEFSVQNFLSFKEKQTISFVATSDKTHLDELTIEVKPNLRLLKMAMIYGANASGKSNLLQAIQTCWMMLFSPTDSESEKIRGYQPFALTKNQPTAIEIIFWANGKQFKYQLEYDESSILYEKMEFTSDKGILSDMFERKKGEPIQFGGKLGIKAKQKDDLNKDTLHNHTTLSTLNKKNIEVPQVMWQLYNWIKGNVHELGIHNDGAQIAKEAEENPNLKKQILELLNKADFNITDFSMIEVKPPKEFVEEIGNDQYLSEQAKDRMLRPRKHVLLAHSTNDESFQISFGMESTGTRAYFRLARILFDLKKDGFVFMEDELERALHYDLLIHYLQTYLENSGKSQFILATHNLLLLDEDWLLRRDMVWFVEKDRKVSASRLYRASDMGLHKNVSLLNAYRIGKLGAKPVLGSTLLNSEGE
jgi:uncharacterized protein